MKDQSSWEYDYIANAPIIHIEDAFYIFKELVSSNKKIRKLDAGYKWSDVGDMVSTYGRSNFNVIYNDEYALIIGGYGAWPTEKCFLSNDQMKCTIPDPESELNMYGCSGLFLVTSDFCKSNEIED